MSDDQKKLEHIEMLIAEACIASLQLSGKEIITRPREEAIRSLIMACSMVCVLARTLPGGQDLYADVVKQIRAELERRKAAAT
jgi:hypothetical protein